MKLKNLIKKPDFLRWWVKTRLIRRYKYLLEVNKVLEEYVTTRVIDGETNRRKELVEKQKEIAEMNRLIDFFKRI